jgi:hypothetical protein
MCVRLAMVASALALVAGLALPAFAQDEKTPAWAQVLPKDGQVLVTWAAVKDATGYTVSRRMVGEEIDKAKAVNAAPVKETSLVDQGLTNGTSYIYSVVASFADGSKGDPKEAVGTPQAAITLAGKPFQSYDVETLNPGSAKVDGNVLTIQGAGADIWDAADGHTFLATPVSGDFTFTIKLNEKPVIANDGSSDFGKVGPQVKAGVNPGSPYALVFASVSRDPEFMLEGRRVQGGGDTFSGPAGGEGVLPDDAKWPTWLRLVRKGQVFQAFYSEDGTNFKQIFEDQTMQDMPADVYVGIAATSHNDDERVIGKIDVPSITLTTP